VKKLTALEHLVSLSRNCENPRLLNAFMIRHSVPWRNGPLQFFPHYLITYVVSGRIRVSLDGIEHILNAGTLFILPPGNRKFFSAKEADLPSVDYRVHIKLAEKSIQKKIPRIEPFIVQDCFELKSYFRKISAFYRENRSHKKNRLNKSHILSLLTLVFCEAARNLYSANNKGAFSLNEKVNIETYIQENCEWNLRPKHLAQKMGLSVDYFSRKFKKTWKIPPREYILRSRLERAAIIIKESNAPIYRAAEICGFENISLFNRQFKKYLGKTPGNASGL